MSSTESAPPPVPPFGVKVTTDLEYRASGIRARARWIDPQTRRRVVRALVVPDEEAAEAFFNDLRRSSEIGIDRRIALRPRGSGRSGQSHQGLRIGRP